MINVFKKSETRITTSVLKQDPNTENVCVMFCPNKNFFFSFLFLFNLLCVWIMINVIWFVCFFVCFLSSLYHHLCWVQRNVSHTVYHNLRPPATSKVHLPSWPWHQSSTGSVRLLLWQATFQMRHSTDAESFQWWWMLNFNIIYDYEVPHLLCPILMTTVSQVVECSSYQP